MDQILTESVSQIRKAVQIPHLQGNCAPGRETFSLLLKQSFQAGQHTLGFKGKYPGLVEEALLTLQAKKPLFLLGSYGGASHAICQALQGQQPEALTESYQSKNAPYKSLLQKYNQRIADQQLDLTPIDYQVLCKTFAGIGMKGLNNGLTNEENSALFSTVNVEEAIGLIMTGLAKLASRSNPL